MPSVVSWSGTCTTAPSSACWRSLMTFGSLAARRSPTMTLPRHRCSPKAMGEAQAALSELRTLAHGIYPAILGEAGLAPAVYSLADTTAVPVEISGMPEGRYPTAVETAAYILVAEGLDNAAHRDASHVTVDIVQDGGWLMVMVEDDGSDRTSDLIHLADRVGALDGRLVVESTCLRAALPCA